MAHLHLFSRPDERLIEAEACLDTNCQQIQKLGQTDEALVVNAGDLMSVLDKTGLELARCGNNINQLARYANRLQKHGVLSPGVAHDYRALLEVHNRQQQELQKLFRKLLRMATA